ncbi:hypothetical protein SSP35_17_00300 [Streptomyces sp. NBRC 110611]|uniref:hypothetical protein n=1 Tax=Streptomyces sp. NBRC 110611 TaxID=1621259 RepID=UPI0008330E93|nr:hypothetical protein [Streptomyces sp. NBRC 110611]GAU70175.1 hypothetical protein SSP35_17_00300 [Streptomyces sp. NBRC 110611]
MSSSPADRRRSPIPPPPPLRSGVRPLIARPVLAFVALLAVLFALSYGAGALAGPVAPGLRPAGGTGTGPNAPADGGDMSDMRGMDGMHGMGAVRGTDVVRGMGAPAPRPVTPGAVAR